MPYRITALVENTTCQEQLICEHGLSLLIEGPEATILFDTGPGPHFLQNADKMGIDLLHLDAVAISHPHCDHAGGLLDLLQNRPLPRHLYLGPHFFKICYLEEEDKRLRLVSTGMTVSDLEKTGVSFSLLSDNVTPIAPHCYLITHFQTLYPEEPVNPVFLRPLGDQMVVDPFTDEIALVLDTPTGLHLVCGCSHRGILNICENAKAYFHKPLLSVTGGTHLKDADDARIEQVVSYFEKNPLQRLSSCHCTGERVNAILEQRLSFYQPLRTGGSLILD